ncbi:BatD family protein [Rheinheimera riviphila]|nr:BatD family protein [Rheinheimera riviphila]
MTRTEMMGKKVTSDLWHGLLLLSVLTLASAAQAATSLNVRVDKNPVMLGEELQLSVQVDEKVSSSAIDFSVLEDHFRVGPPSVSQSMQIINGQSSQSTIWQLSLFAKTTGTFEIPAFNVHGITSSPISIEVIPASQQTTDKQVLFIESNLSQTELYVQQMVYYEVKIYFSGDLQRGSLSQPELPNTTIEQVGKDVEGTELVNGIRYQTITRRYSLIPQQSGSFTLEAPFFNGEMIDRNSSRYDYFAKTQTISAQGQAVEFQVKAMPAEFNGDWLVSELVALTEEWTPLSTTLVQGEPVTRTITLTAMDLADHQLPDLQIDLPAGIKNYAEQPQAKKAERNGRIVAQKVFTSAVIATQSGELKLPAVRVPWWNSKTNQLAYAELPERTLTVTANPNQAGQPPPAADTAVETQVSETAATPVSATHAWQWNYLSGLLLLLWLLTAAVAVWGWLRGRSTTARTDSFSKAAKPNHPQASEVKFNARRFKAACLENDSIVASQQLLRWASQQLDADIQQLPQLIKALPQSELRQETAKLAYQAYQAQPTPWLGTALFEAWAKYKHLQQVESPALLKPFYPK